MVFSKTLPLTLLFQMVPRFHSLVIDVTMALDTLSLPVLEPLTPGRLLDMTVLALSCLYAGRWKNNCTLVLSDCSNMQQRRSVHSPTVQLKDELRCTITICNE